MNNKQIPISRPSLGEGELKNIKEILNTGWLGFGSEVKKFEKRLSEYLSGGMVAALSSCTAALHLALDSLGIGKGDEVLVPSMTFAGSVQVITQTGATPKFCDVLPNNLNIDPDDIEKKITKNSKVIMPIHFSGFPCEIDRITKIAKGNNLRIVEDAAHAFGSSYKGKKIGSFGDITCFSFDPIKNLTCGEGGAIVTGDEKVYNLAVKKRILGIDKDTWSRYKGEKSWSYDVVEQGYRYHMSNINAAIGLEQFNKFIKNNNRKIEVARQYDQAFKKIKSIELLDHNYNDIGLFNYIIKIKNNKRDQLIDFLGDENIISGVHYIPCHYFSIYKKFKTQLPFTEKIFKEIITLPLFASITDNEVKRVINSVQDFFK